MNNSSRAGAAPFAEQHTAPTATHTRGPWRALIAPDDDLRSGEVDLICVEHCCFDALGVAALEANNDHDSIAEHQANTRLVAAAPDLLGALRSIALCTDDPAIRSIAKEAIAKATGETNA